MPSSAVKLLIIMYMISLVFLLMCPDAGLGTQLVNKFVNTSSKEGFKVSSKINESLPQQPSGILTGVNQFIAPIAMVWKAIGLIVDVITAPIAMANYLISQGAPWEVVVLAVSPFVVLIFGAIIDFVRSGA